MIKNAKNPRQNSECHAK